MVGAVAELGLVRVLAAGAAERFDARFAVRAAHPAIAGAELELRQRRRPLTALIVARSTGVLTPFSGGLAAGATASAYLPLSDSLLPLQHAAGFIFVNDIGGKNTTGGRGRQCRSCVRCGQVGRGVTYNSAVFARAAVCVDAGLWFAWLLTLSARSFEWLVFGSGSATAGAESRGVAHRGHPESWRELHPAHRRSFTSWPRCPRGRLGVQFATHTASRPTASSTSRSCAAPSSTAISTSRRSSPISSSRRVRRTSSRSGRRWFGSRCISSSPRSMRVGRALGFWSGACRARRRRA